MAKRTSDPKAPDSQVRITDFGGMSPGTDQHDNDPGLSWHQVNVVPFHPGELRVRGGFSVVRFESEPGEEGADIPPAQVRFSDALSRMLLHPDARRARDIDPEAFSAIRVTGTADAVRVMCESTAILAAFADAYVDPAPLPPGQASASVILSASASSFNLPNLLEIGLTPGSAFTATASASAVLELAAGGNDISLAADSGFVAATDASSALQVAPPQLVNLDASSSLLVSSSASEAVANAPRVAAAGVFVITPVSRAALVGSVNLAAPGRFVVTASASDVLVKKPPIVVNLSASSQLIVTPAPSSALLRARQVAASSRVIVTPSASGALVGVMSLAAADRFVVTASASDVLVPRPPILISVAAASRIIVTPHASEVFLPRQGVIIRVDGASRIIVSPSGTVHVPSTGGFSLLGML